MRGIQSSKVQEVLTAGTAGDYRNIGQGIVGFIPQGDGTVNYIPEEGNGGSSIPLVVQAGNPPPIMGKVQILDTTNVDLVICL